MDEDRIMVDDRYDAARGRLRELAVREPMPSPQYVPFDARPPIKTRRFALMTLGGLVLLVLGSFFMWTGIA